MSLPLVLNWNKILRLSSFFYPVHQFVENNQENQQGNECNLYAPRNIFFNFHTLVSDVPLYLNAP